MLARTSSLAQQRVAGVPLSQVFNPMPLVRKVVIALGLALAIGLLAVMAPGVLELVGRAESAPGRHHVAAQDPPGGIGLYETAGTWPRWPPGGNFDLRVQAFRGDTEIPVVPEKVEVRYRDEGGGRDRKTMRNIGRPATSSVGQG